jgi:hypothetical protein
VGWPGASLRQPHEKRPAPEGPNEVHVCGHSHFARPSQLAETLPTLRRNPSRPEDVLKVDADDDGAGGDDAADCLRYPVATRAREVSARKLRGLWENAEWGTQSAERPA